MTERPILFSGPMVRALLDGSKTQTRRVVKPAPPSNTVAIGRWQDPGPEPAFWAFRRDGPVAHDHPFGGAELHGEPWRCPYGQTGDRLWVRENFDPIYPQNPSYNAGKPIEYDYQATYKHGDRLGDLIGVTKKWKPSIHMPRAASRITLEITGVRVERLQDISEADAKAEGIEQDDYGYWLGPSLPSHNTPTEAFRDLWVSINGTGSWHANTWVWVVDFRRIKP
jgi:hypothetical protein